MLCTPCAINRLEDCRTQEIEAVKREESSAEQREDSVQLGERNVQERRQRRRYEYVSAAGEQTAQSQHVLEFSARSVRGCKGLPDMLFAT